MIATLLMLALPVCDFTVRTAADWARVNDADKRVICVAAAPTYTEAAVGVIRLTASGSPEAPRWLRWLREDDVHPARVPAAETAAVGRFELRGAWWVIDRLVVRDGGYASSLDAGAHHNVLQRMVFEKPRLTPRRRNGLMLWLGDGTHDNVVQDSVFRDGLRFRGGDSYAIYNHKASGETIRGNEFIDLVSGISNGPLAGGNNRILENEFYHTSAIYTDCRGRFDPDGPCSCAEGMAVVAKGPANQPETFVERNVIWGFRPTDPVCAGSGTPGVAINLGSGHPVTRHFTIADNVILAQVPHAIYLGSRVADVTISGNYISGADYGIANGYGEIIRVTDNVFHDNGTNYHTGRMARGTVYRDNRNAGDGELCFTTRHLTDPQLRCVPY